MARTAGIESSANITSVVSITKRVTKRGVAKIFPPSFVKNLPFLKSEATGKYFRKIFKTGFFSGSTFSSFLKPILIPV